MPLILVYDIFVCVFMCLSVLVCYILGVIILKGKSHLDTNVTCMLLVFMKVTFYWKAVLQV